LFATLLECENCRLAVALLLVLQGFEQPAAKRLIVFTERAERA